MFEKNKGSYRLSCLKCEMRMPKLLVEQKQLWEHKTESEGQTKMNRGI